MWKKIGSRLLIAIPTLWVVATLTFVLVQLVPGDPANFILGQSATRASIVDLHHKLGIDRSLIDQYFSWLGHAVSGNLGTSYITGRSVGSGLSVAVPPTVSLAILSTIFALLIGVAFGMLAAVRGGRVDSIVQTVASFGLALPSFWVAAWLIDAFALKFAIFPATGYTALGASPWLWFVGLVLPALSIAINSACQIMLQTRANVLDVLSRDFVRTLQALGVKRRSILLRHVLRNAAIPIATVTGLTFIYTLSGVVVIESIFNTNGLGNLLLSSVQAHDIPTVQGTVLIFGIMVMVVNILFDLVTAWLDPRVRVA